MVPKLFGVTNKRIRTVICLVIVKIGLKLCPLQNYVKQTNAVVGAIIQFFPTFQTSKGLHGHVVPRIKLTILKMKLKDVKKVVLCGIRRKSERVECRSVFCNQGRHSPYSAVMKRRKLIIMPHSNLVQFLIVTPKA